jgi:flagellar biosynthetic protein FliO
VRWRLPLIVAAAEPATWPPDGSIFRGFAATLVVLGLVGALAWIVHKKGFPIGRKNGRAVIVESAVPLGERRSLVVVAVEGRRLLLGLTPVQVSLVTELAAPPKDFDGTLDRALQPSAGHR